MGIPGSFTVNSQIQPGTGDLSARVSSGKSKSKATVSKKRKSLTSTTTGSSRPIICTDSIAQALKNLGKELNDSNVISDIAPLPLARKPKLASEFTPAAIDGSEELHIGFTPDAANVDINLEKSKEIPIEAPKEAHVPDPYPNVNFPTSPTANSQMCAEFGVLFSPAEPFPSKTQAQPPSMNFEDLVKMAMQSPSNASLGSSQPPVYSDDHLLLILKQLLSVGKHMLLLRNASQGPLKEVATLNEKVSSLQNELKDIFTKKDADILEKDNLISFLQKENTSIAAKRDEIISEKDKIATSLADELSVKQMLERKIKKLETDLESSSKLKEDVERVTKENAELTKRNVELIEENELLSKHLQRKSSLLDSSNNFIMGAKEKVVNFLDVALPRIKEECYEEALYIAYANNIQKCPDLDFPSLDINERCKRKFGLILKKDIETLKREFPEVEKIKAEEWLSFADDSSDEESQPEDKRDGDNDDDDGGEHNDGDDDGSENNGHMGEDDGDRHDDHGGGESSEANPPSQPHNKDGTGDANQAPPAQDVEAATTTSSPQKGPSGRGSAHQSQKPAERKTPPPPVPSSQALHLTAE